MPSPFLMTEGPHVDHFGSLIWPIYVDFRELPERQAITRLVKGCRAEHAIETSQTVLISKPSRFRDLGENLIRDTWEARASQKVITYEAIDDPDHLAEARRRDKAVNRAYELVGATMKTRTNSVRRTRFTTRSLTNGKNGWIFLRFNRTHHAPSMGTLARDSSGGLRPRLVHSTAQRVRSCPCHDGSRTAGATG